MRREKWQREAALVADHSARASDPIILNIGRERTVTTTRATFTRGDSMLAAMFSGRHKLNSDAQVRLTPVRLRK